MKIRKLSFKKSPLEIFSQLYNHYESAYILESIEGPKKLSQYSFIGFNPELTITIKNGEAVIHNERTGEEDKEKGAFGIRAFEGEGAGHAVPEALYQDQGLF